MQSIIHNYSVLQSLWDQAADIVHDTETIAHIRGVAAHMQSFEFFFGLVQREILLHHTDNLSKTLRKNYSASEGQRVADMTKRTLHGIRDDQSFDLFWEKVSTMASDVDVNDPVLPRKRKVPKLKPAEAECIFIALLSFQLPIIVYVLSIILSLVFHT